MRRIAAGEGGPEYESIRGIARRFRRGRDTVRAAIERGELRAFRQGPSRVLIRAEDARRWIEQEPVVPCISTVEWLDRVRERESRRAPAARPHR